MGHLEAVVKTLWSSVPGSYNMEGYIGRMSKSPSFTLPRTAFCLKCLTFVFCTKSSTEFLPAIEYMVGMQAWARFYGP